MFFVSLELLLNIARKGITIDNNYASLGIINLVRISSTSFTRVITIIIYFEQKVIYCNWVGYKVI